MLASLDYYNAETIADNGWRTAETDQKILLWSAEYAQEATALADMHTQLPTDWSGFLADRAQARAGAWESFKETCRQDTANYNGNYTTYRNAVATAGKERYHPPNLGMSRNLGDLRRLH